MANRDSLTIDGEEILTSEHANAEETLIALSHYDADTAQVEGDDPSIFSFIPFLGATDRFWAADESNSIHVSFNDKSIHVPSRGEGVLITLL